MSGSHLSPSGTGGFELTFLGTSSQGGARRFPSCLALRLRGTASSEVWLFDAGEGAIAQLQRSNMRVGLVRNIFVTHLHGDHLYGLPGLVMSILGRRDVPNMEDVTLDVYGPQGVRAFLRTSLGVAGFRIPRKGALRINELIWPSDYGGNHVKVRHQQARPYWRCAVKRLPFESPSRDISASLKDGKYTYILFGQEESEESEDGKKWNEENLPVDGRRWIGSGPASVVAAPVLHTVPTYAFGVTENVVTRRFNKTKLQDLGIPTDGRKEVRQLFQKWLAGETATWKGKNIEVDHILQDGRAPRTMCVIGDTFDASGASHIAKKVDVLVHEATNVAAQTNLARSRGHSSTVGATAFARKVRAKRLILNHISVSYSDRKILGMEAEARSMFGVDKAFVARDLSLFSVPTEEEDNADFGFRRFVGFTDCNRVGWSKLPYEQEETEGLVDERIQEGVNDVEEGGLNNGAVDEEEIVEVEELEHGDEGSGKSGGMDALSSARVEVAMTGGHSTQDEHRSSTSRTWVR